MNDIEIKEVQTIDSEKKSSTKAVGEFFKKASLVSKKVAVNLQETANSTTERIKADNKNRRYKKYHPITAEEYKSENFNIPNVVKIVDDADTRNIDVCENSVGRLVTEKGVEILYINDEFVSACGLHFVPSPVCEAIYHVDNFDRSRFIRTDEIFGKALEEKLAELEHIAFSLGALRCSIEIVEESVENENRITDTQSQGAFSRKPKKKPISGEAQGISESKSYSTVSSSGKITTTFSGEMKPQMPRLKWFEHNDNMKNLIEMRLSKGSSVRSKTLVLKGASSASMAQKTAVAIDSEILKMGIKSNNNIERQAQIERNSKLIFEVVFEE